MRRGWKNVIFGVFMLKMSPFDAVHRSLEAHFGEYAGWSLPADFGDPAAEAAALAGHCAVVDLCSFGRIAVKGAQAAAVMEAVFSEKSGKFLAETWVWAKGERLGDVLCRVVRINGDWIVVTEPESTKIVLEALETAANGAVSVTDVTEKTAMLGLYGPAAFESMQGVLPFEIDHLDAGDVDKMSFFMISFTLIRGSWAGGDGLELICPAAAGPVAASAVAKYRHKHNITPAGMDCLKAAMAGAAKPL
jgi:aminomethyltransferase